MPESEIVAILVKLEFQLPPGRESERVAVLPAQIDKDVATIGEGVWFTVSRI
jgi:hypothetical protein